MAGPSARPGLAELRALPRRLQVVGASGALVLLLGLVTAAVGPQETTTITGTFALFDEATAANDCEGEGGYGDIEPGTEVTLRNESGEILGSDSFEVDTTVPGVGCIYAFAFEDVSTGHKQYSIEVSDRGRITNDRTEMEDADWSFSASLGQD